MSDVASTFDRGAAGAGAGPAAPAARTAHDALDAPAAAAPRGPRDAGIAGVAAAQGAAAAGNAGHGAGADLAARLSSPGEGFALPLPGDVELSAGWDSAPVPRSPRNTDVAVAVETKRHVGFPGICTLAGGAILIVYREGLVHAGGKDPADGRVMMVESRDNGATWSEPWLVYDDPGVDDRNSALMCTKDGTVVHVWNKYKEGVDFGAFLATSKDRGRTWSDPVRIGTSPCLRTRCSPIEIDGPDGETEWLVPLYDCVSDEKAAYLAILSPPGTLKAMVPVTPPGDRNISDEWAIAEAKDGRLVALIRSNWDRCLWQAESFDKGRTWSGLRPSALPSQFAPADLIRHTSGDLVATFSFRERCNERQARSRDCGKTWEVAGSIDVFDARLRGDRAYPAVCELKDGRLGIALYETLPAPQGGRIYFARTRTRDFDRPPASALHSSVAEHAVFFAVFRKVQGEALGVGQDGAQNKAQAEAPGAGFAVVAEYRFTGGFGEPLNGVHLLMQDVAGRLLEASYWMGGGRGDTNRVEIAVEQGAERTVLLREPARGDLFNDGNDHRAALVVCSGRAFFAIDGHLQGTAGLPWAFRPARPGLAATRATVAVFGFDAAEWTDG